jgi:CRP-like cAMP-binding protein
MMLQIDPAALQNRLLRSLGDEALLHLQSFLVREHLRFQQQLQSANRPITTVYFIEDGLASVVPKVPPLKRSVEIGLVGYEGMVGAHCALDVDCATYDVFMQVEGAAFAMSAPAFRELIGTCVPLRRAVLRYIHVFATQTAYTSVANARCSIEERVARWLLMAQDRLGTADVRLSQELYSLMLGVRRAGISTALHDLEERHLIETKRTVVSVLDRQGLIEFTGGLYGIPEREFWRLFQTEP